MSFLSEAERIKNLKILLSPEIAAKFSKDRSPLKGEMPLAVFEPKSAQQISKLMLLCYKYDVHVTVRGGGTSLTGASVPRGKGIVIDMSGFHKILKIDV